MRQIACAQCGRALAPTDSATTVCPSCGSSAVVPTQTIARSGLASDDSATRPALAEPTVPAPALAVALPEQERPTLPPPPPLDATTMTASPLGAFIPPSLPRSTGQAHAEPIPPGGDEGDERSPNTPSALLRGKDPVHDTHPVDGPIGLAAGVQRPQRGGLTAVSAIALVVVLAVGTAGAILAANGHLTNLFSSSVQATPTVAPTATAGPPAPPAGYTRFTASDGTYTLVLPSGWAHITSGSLTLFADPQAGTNFEIESLTAQLDAQTVSNDFLARLDPAPPGTSGTATIGPLVRDSVPVAGTAWTRTTTDLSVTASGTTVQWHVVVLVTQRTGATLLAAYFAPNSIFAREDTTHFQVMLDSLTLLSPQP